MRMQFSHNNSHRQVKSASPLISILLTNIKFVQQSSLLLMDMQIQVNFYSQHPSDLAGVRLHSNEAS